MFTRTDAGIRYLLVQNLQGLYGFPKGHVEGSETEEETALREVQEETGVQIRILPSFRMTDIYPIPGREEITKEVIYFVGCFAGQEPRYQREELRSADLFSLEEAMERLAFERQRTILIQAAAYLNQGNGLQLLKKGEYNAIGNRAPSAQRNE